MPCWLAHSHMRQVPPWLPPNKSARKKSGGRREHKGEPIEQHHNQLNVTEMTDGFPIQKLNAVVPFILFLTYTILHSFCAKQMTKRAKGKKLSLFFPCDAFSLPTNRFLQLSLSLSVPFTELSVYFSCDKWHPHSSFTARTLRVCGAHRFEFSKLMYSYR